MNWSWPRPLTGKRKRLPRCNISLCLRTFPTSELHSAMNSPSYETAPHQWGFTQKPDEIWHRFIARSIDVRAGLTKRRIHLQK